MSDRSRPPETGDGRHFAPTRAPGRVKEVSSVSNPIVKDIRALAQKRHRDETGLFLAEGLKLAVASSSIHRFVDVSLARMFAAMGRQELDAGVFSTIVCGDDPEIAARKPAPDIYLRAAERVGLGPAECMALEDSGSGVSSALAAGISRTIAVPNIYTHGHDFAGAYAVLASVAEVPALDFFPRRASS